MPFINGIYKKGEKQLPAVTASLATGTDGHVYLALVNLDPDNEASIALNFSNGNFSKLTGELLTHDSMTAKNTFEHKEVVKPVSFSASLSDLTLPAKSVLVGRLQ